MDTTTSQSAITSDESSKTIIINNDNNNNKAQNIIIENSDDGETEPLNYNNNNNNNERESLQMLSNAIQQVRDAVESVPNSSIAYKTALEKCTHYIMTKEANPIYFLRRTSYNCWDAARLMCEYWNLRVEVFGHDRCYKSVLDLSDNGALSESAKKMVKLGTATILPYDQYGRPVFYKERVNLTPKIQQQLGINAQSKVEAVFWSLQVLVELPKIGTEGFSIVNVFTEPKPYISPQVHDFVSRACRDCFPIKLNVMRIIHAPRLKSNRTVAKENFIKTFVPFIWQLHEKIFNYTSRAANLIVIENHGPYSYGPTCEEQIASYLMSVGLKKEFLPPSAGGSWTYEHFIQWLNNNHNNNNNNSIRSSNNMQQETQLDQTINNNNNNNIDTTTTTTTTTTNTISNNNNNNKIQQQQTQQGLLMPLEVLAVTAAGIEPLKLEG